MKSRVTITTHRSPKLVCKVLISKLRAPRSRLFAYVCLTTWIAWLSPNFAVDIEPQVALRLKQPKETFALGALDSQSVIRKLYQYCNTFGAGLCFPCSGKWNGIQDCSISRSRPGGPHVYCENKSKSASRFGARSSGITSPTTLLQLAASRRSRLMDECQYVTPVGQMLVQVGCSAFGT